MFKLLTKGLIYSFSVGTEAIIAAALLPLLTARLAPADYALWVIYIALSGFLRPVLNLMFQDILRMRYYSISSADLLKLLKIALFLPLILAGLILAIAVIFSKELSVFFNFPASGFWAVLIFAVIHGYYYLLLALMQFKEKPGLFFQQQLGQTIITILLSFLFLQFENSWMAPALARILALLINCTVGFVWVQKNFGIILKAEIDKKYFYDFLKTGSRFLPVGLASVVVPLTDRLIVSHLVGMEQTSYFGIGALFSSAVLILSTGLIYAWQPLLYKSIQQKEDNPHIRLYALLYFLALPLGALLLALFGVFIAPYMMHYDSSEVKVYIYALTVAAVAEGYYQYIYVYLKGWQRTNAISIFSVLLIIINFIFVSYFVKLYGGIGAAYGTALSFFVILLTAAFFLIAKPGKKD